MLKNDLNLSDYQNSTFTNSLTDKFAVCVIFLFEIAHEKWHMKQQDRLTSHIITRALLKENRKIL